MQSCLTADQRARRTGNRVIRRASGASLEHPPCPLPSPAGSWDQHQAPTLQEFPPPRGVPQRPSQSPSPCPLPSRLAHAEGPQHCCGDRGTSPDPTCKTGAWPQGRAPQLRTGACCHQLPASEWMLMTCFPSPKGLVRTREGRGRPQCWGEALPAWRSFGEWLSCVPWPLSPGQRALTASLV